MSTITKDLGPVSAYAYAVTQGYTGTEEEFAELMADYADVGQTAVEAAQTATTKASEASASAGTASTAATTATTKASEATTAAGTASTAASTATTKASEANTSAGTAAQNAVTAANAAATAGTAAQNAQNAQTAAEAAQSKAETAQGKAEEYATYTKDTYEAVADALRAKTYGVKWNRLTNTLTRTRDAVGITADTTNFCHKGSLNANYSNPFDEIYPWSEMTVCDVDLTAYRNRTGEESLTEFITAVYGDPDFTYFGSNTNFVGRYRPEFWYRSEEDSDGNVEFMVSQYARPGFLRSPEAIDGVGFCIDDGNGGVTSGTDVVLTNIALSSIHSRAKSSGFTLQDIYSIDAQIILYLVEYANMNAQAALGDGCSSSYRENAIDIISNVVIGNGETSFDITDSAEAAYMHVGTQMDIGATAGAVTYRGLIKSYTIEGSTEHIVLDRELAVADGMIASVHGMASCEFGLTNASVGSASGYIDTNGKNNSYYRGAVLYGNRYSYVLGIYRQTGTNHIWLCPDTLDPDDYDALNTTVHEDTGTALPNLETAAWVTVGGNAQRIAGLAAFMATGESSGSSSSPVGDQQYVPLITAGNTVLLFGGSASYGWRVGVFCGSWGHGSGSSAGLIAGVPLLKKSL